LSQAAAVALPARRRAGSAIAKQAVAGIGRDAARAAHSDPSRSRRIAGKRS